MSEDKKPRKIHCSIEMDLEEGEDFNISGMNLADEDAKIAAETSFIDMVQQIATDFENNLKLEDFVKTEIL